MNKYYKNLLTLILILGFSVVSFADSHDNFKKHNHGNNVHHSYMYNHHSITKCTDNKCKTTECNNDKCVSYKNNLTDHHMNNYNMMGSSGINSNHMMNNHMMSYYDHNNLINIGLYRNILTKYHNNGAYEQRIADIAFRAQYYLKNFAKLAPNKLRIKAQKWNKISKSRRQRILSMHKQYIHNNIKSYSGVYKSPFQYNSKTTAYNKSVIVFDIDETLLSNWKEIKANQFGFFPKAMCPTIKKGPCGWNEWVKKSDASAIKPMLKLYKFAIAHNFKVFFITGRHESQRQATLNNLQKAGFTEKNINTYLILKPNNFKGSAEDYKIMARTKLENQGYMIILNIGDQFSDITGGHAIKAYKLPNPFYYVP